MAFRGVILYTVLMGSLSNLQYLYQRFLGRFARDSPPMYLGSGQWSYYDSMSCTPLKQPETTVVYTRVTLI